jgi:AsmA protein
VSPWMATLTHGCVPLSRHSNTHSAAQKQRTTKQCHQTCDYPHKSFNPPTNSNRITSPSRGCSSMVERELPKLLAWVRFPSPAPTQQSNRKERMAKFLKFIGMLAGILIVVSILAFVLLVTFVSPNRLKPMISEQVKSYTGRKLTIDGDLSWTFYPYLGVKVGHVTLSNPADFKQATFVEIDNATIGVSLFPLLHGQIESKGITLHGMKLNLIKNAAGRTNWTMQTNVKTETDSSVSSTPRNYNAASMGLAVSAIDITDAHVTWSDEQTKQTTEIDHFAFHATQINLTQPFPISAEFDFSSTNPDKKGHVAFSSKTAFSIDKAVYSLRDLDLAASINQGDKKPRLHVTGDIVTNMSDQTLQWTNFKADLANLNLAGNLNVSHLSTSPQATGHFTIKPFDLKSFLNDVGQDNANLQTAKNVDGALEFTASGKNINATGNFKIEELQAAKIKMSNVDLKMHYQDGVLNLAPVTAKLYDGSMDLTAKINLTTAQPQIALQGKLVNVQSEPLMKDLSSTSQKIKVIGAGNIDFNVTTQGKEGDAIIRNLNGTSHFTFNNGALEGVDIGYYIDSASALASSKTTSASNTNKTTFGNLSGTAVISNGVVKNDDLLLNSPRFDTKGQGTVNLVSKDLDYSLQITVKQTDVSTLKNFAGLAIPVRVTGSLNNPSVRVDTGKLLKGVADQELQKHKDDIKKKIEEQLPGKAGQLLQNILGH